MRFPFLVSLSLTACLFQSMPATAAEPGSVSNWAFQLGAAGMVQPTYEGSKHYEVSPVPLIGVSWRDTVSLDVKDGLKVQMHPLQDKRLSVSGSLGYWQGRKEGADKDNDDALRGLGNISGNAVARLGAEYQIGALSAGLTIARDVGGDRDGTALTFSGKYMVYQGAGFQISADASTTLADDNYMGSMFGISAEQAARSLKGYAIHDAGAGVKDVKIGMTVGYAISPSLNMFVRTEAGRLIGDAADSPIVKDAGSENQFSGGAGLSYRF